jgi:cbb3-type cytochrome oxidase subunit 3
MVIWELLIPLELFLLVCFFLYLWRMEKRSRFLGHQEKRIKLADQLENLAKECA